MPRGNGTPVPQPAPSFCPPAARVRTPRCARRPPFRGRRGCPRHSRPSLAQVVAHVPRDSGPAVPDIGGCRTVWQGGYAARGSAIAGARAGAALAHPRRRCGHRKEGAVWLTKKEGGSNGANSFLWQIFCPAPPENSRHEPTHTPSRLVPAGTMFGFATEAQSARPAEAQLTTMLDVGARHTHALYRCARTCVRRRSCVRCAGLDAAPPRPRLRRAARRGGQAAHEPNV